MNGVDELAFSCPHCDQKIAVPKESAGQAMACPSCLGEVIVPAAGQTLAAGQSWKRDVGKQIEEEKRQEVVGLGDRAKTVAGFGWLCFAGCGMSVLIGLLAGEGGKEIGLWLAGGFFGLGLWL